MIKRDKIEVMDMQTGEVIRIECDDVEQLMQCIRGTAIKLDKAIMKVPASSDNEDFIQMNQKGLKGSGKSKELSGCDNRIWEYCCGDAEYGGKIKSTQSEIAKALDITPSRINRAFKRLRDSGMILTAGFEKGTPTFKVANSFAIKGKRELDGTPDMAQVIRLDQVRDNRLKTA